MVRDMFNRLAERRQWSWLRRHSAFNVPVFTVTDTVSIQSNSALLTGSGAQFLPAMVGCQVRLGGSAGTNYPTYTIASYLSPSTVLLDMPWAGPSQSASAYTVFQCYYPVPADFQSWYSLIDTTNNYHLWTDISQAEIDRCDPQRIQNGNAFSASFYDYTQNYIGSIAPALQVAGSGPSPVSTTASGYSYPASSVYSLQILTGGIVGTATYQWKQDIGVYSTPQLTNAAPVDLSNGVQVYFPVGTYVTGDTFIIQCAADVTTGVPRYELWPRPVANPRVYPFTYIAKLPDLSDSLPTLPDFIARRGDVLLEMCLEQAAMWPGTETMRNPYYDLALANRHNARSEMMINELEMKDDNTATADLVYTNMDWAPAPWLDGSYQQTHAWPAY